MPKADPGSKNSNRFDQISTPEGPVNNEPMLELIKTEIVASQQAAIIQL
jgi:hypothetical protein